MVRACSGPIAGRWARPASVAARSTSSAFPVTGRPFANVTVSSMPTRRWPPAASAANMTGSVVRPIPVADQVAPSGSAETAWVSVAASPGIPPGTPMTRSQWTWPPCGAPWLPSSRCSVAMWPKSNSSNSGTTPSSCVLAYRSRMNGYGLWNTSSPKLTVPQVSEHASGPAPRTASRSSKLSVTAPPVDSCTMRSVPSRSAATVSLSRERSRVGRASASLICTWTTAAPAAWHSFAVVTSSSRVTGSAGTADFSDSAPVGATVIRVAAVGGLLLMIRACLPCPGRVHPGWLSVRFRCSRWARASSRRPGLGVLCGARRGRGQVAPGEVERLGQVGEPCLAGGGPAGVDLEHDHARVAVRTELLQYRPARLGATPGHQMLVPVRHPGPVGHVHVSEPVTQFLGHRVGVRTRRGRVGQVKGHVRGVHEHRVPVRRVGGQFGAAGAQWVHVLHREDDVGLLTHPRQALVEVLGVLPLPAERRVHHDNLGAKFLRRFLGPDQLSPRLVAPHPLGDQQAGRMDGQHGHAVIV